MAAAVAIESSAEAGWLQAPAQDLAAEQSVLGAMMMSKDAIADVVEILRAADFYRPAHEMIFDSIINLYGRGEPADAIPVGDELTKQGELTRAGGLPYLHTLLQTVTIAANAGYYAGIVRQKSTLRRLSTAATRIAYLAHAGEGEADDLVDRAQAELYAVTDRRSSDDYVALSQLMQPVMDEIEAIGARGDLGGVPTGLLISMRSPAASIPDRWSSWPRGPGCGSRQWHSTLPGRRRSSTGWPRRSSRWR